MEKERISRVLSLALNTERLKERQLNASSLISEINIDYGRTMSAIIFEQRAAAYHAAADGTPLTTQPQPSGDMIFAGFALPPPPKRRPVPELACVDIPSHDCLDNKKGFAFQVCCQCLCADASPLARSILLTARLHDMCAHRPSSPSRRLSLAYTNARRSAIRSSISPSTPPATPNP